MRRYLALSAVLLIALPGFAATTAARSANDGQPAIETFCGHGHANWVRQHGFFSWEGRGFDWNAGQWIWQKPAHPDWPDVKVKVHIASPWDWDDECDWDDDDHHGGGGCGCGGGCGGGRDDDRDDDRWGRCSGLVTNRRTNPPDLYPRASLTLGGYDIRVHLTSLSRAASDGSLIAHIVGELTFDDEVGFMWVGLHMPGKADKLEWGEYGMTGKILDGMVPRPRGRCVSRNRPFDLELLMTDDLAGDGIAQPPLWYGPVPGGVEDESLYWPVWDAGTHQLDWTVRLLPDANQGTGIYDFDPVVVLRPADALMPAPARLPVKTDS